MKEYMKRDNKEIWAQKLLQIATANDEVTPKLQQIQKNFDADIELERQRSNVFL